MRISRVLFLVGLLSVAAGASPAAAATGMVEYGYVPVSVGTEIAVGHELILQLHAPPPNDPLSIGTYPPQPPAVVSVLQDPEHQSSVLLPFLPRVPETWHTPPTCAEIAGERCMTPPA